MGKRKKRKKQAGAELCQAQLKLGLAMLDLHSTKLRSSSLYEKIEVIFHLIYWSSLPSMEKVEVVFHLQDMRSSSISKKIEVVFHCKLSKHHINALVYI
jgi:hypothetical protein